MTSQLVVFSLGGEDYAFPIAAVSEIIRHANTREVASDTPGVRGVIGLRGKIIPILDLSERVGLSSTADENGKIIVLDTAGGQIGVMVDDVDQVVTVTEDQLEDVPSVVSSTGAIAKLGERLVMVLDPAALGAAAVAASV